MPHVVSDNFHIARGLHPSRVLPPKVVVFQEAKRVERVFERRSHRVALETAHVRALAPLELARSVVAAADKGQDRS
eukprot:1247943-Alexandrium_andersonii.AAC.1